ncbi:MAG: hypothetical protein U0X73_06030 [Thermoanaerobaculia bacterium]
MKVILGTLIVLAAAMSIWWVRWAWRKLQGVSDQKQAHRQSVERRRDRERQDCLSAEQALGSTLAGRDPGAADEVLWVESGGKVSRSLRLAPGQTLAQAVESRRRAATSTAFDPDLP